jgi:hypothetical protein
MTPVHLVIVLGVIAIALVVAAIAAGLTADRPQRRDDDRR